MKVIGRKAFELNAKYSRAWLAVTGLSKEDYRERSIVHKILVSMYRL